MYTTHRLPRVTNGPLYNTATPFGCAPSYRQYSYNTTPISYCNSTIPLNPASSTNLTHHAMQTSFVESHPELLHGDGSSTYGIGGESGNNSSRELIDGGNNNGNDTVIDEGRSFQVC